MIKKQFSKFVLIFIFFLVQCNKEKLASYNMQFNGKSKTIKCMSSKRINLLIKEIFKENESENENENLDLKLSNLNSTSSYASQGVTFYCAMCDYNSSLFWPPFLGGSYSFGSQNCLVYINSKEMSCLLNGMLKKNLKKNNGVFFPKVLSNQVKKYITSFEPCDRGISQFNPDTEQKRLKNPQKSYDIWGALKNDYIFSVSNLSKTDDLVVEFTDNTITFSSLKYLKILKTNKLENGMVNIIPLGEGDYVSISKKGYKKLNYQVCNWDKAGNFLQSWATKIGNPQYSICINNEDFNAFNKDILVITNGSSNIKVMELSSGNFLNVSHIIRQNGPFLYLANYNIVLGPNGIRILNSKTGSDLPCSNFENINIYYLKHLPNGGFAVWGNIRMGNNITANNEYVS